MTRIDADGAAETAPEVAVLRGELDAIDTEIVRLLAERCAIVAEIAQAKERRSVGVRDPDRERYVLARLAAEAQALGIPEELVVEVFSTIIEHSVALQADHFANKGRPRQP